MAKFSAPKRRSLPTSTNVQNIAETLASWQSQLNPVIKNVNPPATPVNFRVTNARGGLQLSWSPVQGADGYEILKSQNGSFTDDLVVIPVSGQNNTSYFDSLGGNAQTARYRIRTTAGTNSNPQSQRGPESGVVSHTSIDAADTASQPTTALDNYTTDSTRAGARFGNYGSISPSDTGLAGGSSGAAGPAAGSGSSSSGSSSSSGGAVTFDSIGTGENVTANMIVGTGAAIFPDVDRPGTIDATNIQGILITDSLPNDKDGLRYSAADNEWELSPTPESIGPTATQFVKTYDETTGLFTTTQPADSDLAISDIAMNNVTSTAHGFAPKAPADATKFLNGAATPAYARVKDSDLSVSDITTNDVVSTQHGFAPKSPADATKFLNGAATPGYAQVKDSDLSISDIATNNVVSTQHGFAPKSPADATKFLNGAATPDYAQVKDSDLSLSDITTNNVSIAAHGFAPKAPNDATKFLNGTGAYSTPAGSTPIDLQTNGVDNGDQTKLNLIAGTNVTLTDNGVGGVTIAASGGGGSGTVTATGSPSSGNLTKFSGATSITEGDLSGDVTTSGTLVTAVVNLPDGVTQAGKLVEAEIAAPASPASGHISVFADSTDHRFHDKNSSGTIGTTVIAETGSANNFLTAISAAGVISKAQPAFADISGTASSGQLPNLDSSKITTGQLALARGGTASDLSATGGASQVLKQSSSGAAVTVGQLAASDLSNGTVGSGSVVLATSPTLVTPNIGVATAGGALNMSSHLVNNVTDPVSAQDAATKNYVDTHTGAPAGTTVSTTNDSYTTGQTRTYDLTMAKTFVSWKVTEATAQKFRLRLYSTSAARTADASRPYTVPLALGTPHGCILELYLPQTGAYITPFVLSTAITGSNGDSSRASTIYASVTNIATSTQSIQVTISFVALES